MSLRPPLSISWKNLKDDLDEKLRKDHDESDSDEEKEPDFVPKIDIAVSK